MTLGWSTFSLGSRSAIVPHGANLGSFPLSPSDLEQLKATFSAGLAKESTRRQQPAWDSPPRSPFPGLLAHGP